MNHPNAFAAGVSFLVVSGVVWLLDHYGYQLSETQKAALDGGVPTAVLFVGTRGLKGTALALYNGLGTVVNGKTAKK